MLLRTVPREVRYDLWRVCEPQHTQAIDRLTEAVAKRVEELFDLVPRERKLISSSVGPPY